MTLATIKLNDGAVIPAVGFGTSSSFFLGDCSTVVEQALEAGYRHFDCAQSYGNQQHVRRGIAASGVPREEIYITTKIGDLGADPNKFDADKFFAQCLEDLGTDYVDLLLLHSSETVPDPVAAWKQLEKSKREGKARSIGVANFTTKALEAVLAACEIVPAFHSMELHPYALPTYLPTMLALCQKHDIAIGAFSPLIPLTRHKGGPVDPVVQRVISERGKAETEAQVLLLWARQVSGGSIITASTKPVHMAEALQPFQTDYLPLSVAHLEAITAAGATAPYRQWGSNWPYLMPGEGGIQACPPGKTHRDIPERLQDVYRKLGKI